MTRFIVFANRKGGCGKTTTAVNVAHCLAMKKKKTLLIDLDPQAHSTISLGKNTHGQNNPSIVTLLNGKKTLNDIIVPTNIDGLSLAPSSRDLISFELEASSRKGSENILSEKLSGTVNRFDFIVFDPPPTIGLLTVSALVAGREVYIPMPMHFLAMEGLAEMMRLIYTLNATCNPDLRLCGVIPTFYNKSTRIAKEIAGDIIKNFGKENLLPGIRMNVSLAEAPGHGKSVLEYAPNSAGAVDYTALADSIINNR